MEEMYVATYQYHSKDEKYYVNSTLVEAESIGHALADVDALLDVWMNKFDWSDYHITGINIVPELH